MISSATIVLSLLPPPLFQNPIPLRPFIDDSFSFSDASVVRTTVAICFISGTLPCIHFLFLRNLPYQHSPFVLIPSAFLLHLISMLLIIRSIRYFSRPTRTISWDWKNLETLSIVAAYAVSIYIPIHFREHSHRFGFLREAWIVIGMASEGSLLGN